MPDQTQLLRAAATFRGSILPAKQATDQMLSRLGDLLSSSASITSQAGLPLADTQDAMSEITTAIAGVMGVRRGLITVHQLAKSVGVKALPELAWGDDEWTEPKPLVVGERNALRVVEG